MPPITVYSKPNCMPCKLTKSEMSKRGIEFNEVDITADPEAYDYVMGLGALSAPVVVVGDKVDVWFGFKPEKISALISA